MIVCCLSHRATRPRPIRAAIALVDLVAVLLLATLAVFVLLPYLLHAIGRATQTGCAVNLQAIGVAIKSYESTHNEALPVGSAYQASPNSPWGTSWWVELLPHLTDASQAPWKQVASSGAFSLDTVNPNYARVAGQSWSVMQCPSSPLPELNDPWRHISAVNRSALGASSQGVAVPSYVAIAGSAPDMRAVGNGVLPAGAALGRTTRDGPRGVLSASGAFPPNRSLRLGALRDGQQHTLLIGEQSDWFYDRQYEPPVYYEARSAWPAGAYTGAGFAYGDLSPTANDSNGSGEAPAYNITTIRHPINRRRGGQGVLTEAATPVPQRPAQAPRSAPELPLPGHNQGLFSSHAGGVNVLFADGHLRFLSDSTDLRILLHLATRDDGQYVDPGPTQR